MMRRPFFSGIAALFMALALAGVPNVAVAEELSPEPDGEVSAASIVGEDADGALGDLDEPEETPDLQTDGPLVGLEVDVDDVAADDDAVQVGLADGPSLELAEEAPLDEAGEGVDLLPAATSDAKPATAVELEASLPEVEDVGVSMYRLYNPYSGEHFYTASTNERDALSGIGWQNEGLGWIAPSAGDPVFRLYNPNSSDHHYTMDANERDTLVRIGWKYEGIGWYSGGAFGLLRQFNPNETIGTHNYTCSQNENDTLVRLGWKAEGIAWYALADTADTLAAYIKDNYAGVLARVSSEDGEVHVVPTVIDDTYYLMLPSFADLSSVRLSGVFKGAETSIMVADSGSTDFKTLQAGDALNVAALSTASADNGARLLWFKTPDAPVVQRLAFMVSSALDSVHVSSVDASQTRSYVEASRDHSAKANVLVTVVDENGVTVYDQDSAQKSSTIKGRGNSTWGIGNKKPYQISLNKKADLLGTGNADNKQKKWVLLANANDATLLHNTVAYNMALELGMVGTECKPVDLYYDGEYRGSYLLCEKIQVKEGRVDIADLEDAIEKANAGKDLESLPTAQATNAYGMTYQYVRGVSDPDDITGGYLLEIDNAYYSKETCWFYSSWGYVVVKSPEFCSQSAMKYISEYVELAVRRLGSGQTTDAPGNAADGALIDLDSLAKAYVISEFTKNIDYFNTSTFLYKDAGATPLYSQPMWDFDGSMGVRNDWTDSAFTTYHGFSLPHTYRIKNIATVQDRARSVWTTQLSPLISNVLLSSNAATVGPKGFLHPLAYYRQQIAASQRMNEVLHGITAFGNEIAPFATYEQNYEYLRNWLTWRTAWLNDNIGRLSGGSVSNPPFVYNGADYGLVFDASYYVQANRSLLGGNTGDEAALAHFVTTGRHQGLVASRNFNVQAYKARYDDLRSVFGDTWASYYNHFIDDGFKEGRLGV